jgi:hypothetical protein
MRAFQIIYNSVLLAGLLVLSLIGYVSQDAFVISTILLIINSTLISKE